MKVKHVLHGSGSHHLETPQRQGQKVGYTHIAELRLNRVTLIATTDYYTGTALRPGPDDVIMQIEPYEGEDEK